MSFWTFFGWICEHVTVPHATFPRGKEDHVCPVRALFWFVAGCRFCFQQVPTVLLHKVFFLLQLQEAHSFGE